MQDAELSPTPPQSAIEALGYLGTHIVCSWEIGLDPWHADAFPSHLQEKAPNQGERQSGWFGLDWAGNAIVFIRADQETPDPGMKLTVI